MDKKIDFNMNPRKIYEEKKLVEAFCEEELEKVRRFLYTIPACSPSPLVSLDNLAKQLNIKGIYIKDENRRCDLKSFKILGASYAIPKYICKELNIDIGTIDFYDIKKEEIRSRLGDLTFTTCSDGNHGRAVAWVANELGFRAVIYLNKGTAEERVEAIRDLGAEAIVTELNYDDTVRYANEKAKENGWVVVQDTSWEGYEEIPLWIMQGYSAMANEGIEQSKDNGAKITHVFLQAGVGAMAGGALGCISNMYKGNHPKTIVVEPHNAACMLKSSQINDGLPHTVSGELNSIMAGLACGEPVKEGWNILRDSAIAFISCSDEVAARGMRILGNPLRGDESVISGESGASTLGVVATILGTLDYNEIRKKLDLNQDSEILLFSTEGDTSPQNYYDIVWSGKIPYIL